ncbi:MAG TPA: undecaprenyldiphospho-muramoylpentapeptide beta-N-acetylglucosaminyltransferase [Geminicoccaceae bacterium]|nr:undecaprenyldiphospho-muramoylpentapeptide beta-N-acetylglucosaminyltransferase [Geminicoccaceae bacterium]
MSGPVVISAGGTGGHMFPALALARELVRRGRRVALVTDRRGARFVEQGLPCHLVAAGSPSGTPSATVVGCVRLAGGVLQSLVLFRRLQPSAAACFGGYASVPAAVAAGIRRRPLMLHEQNAVFGRANRLVARFADAVALTFADTDELPELRTGRVAVTGNPVRPEFAVALAPYAPPEPNEPVRVLVLGGSQGARVLSDVVPAAMALLPAEQRARIVLQQQCRPEDLERARAAYAALQLQAELATFFPDVPRRMGEAHLLIARSGASTVAEILAVGRPSLLVPYRHAADDHQRANAARLAAAGAAEMLEEETLTAGLLAERLAELMAAPDRLAAMAKAALTLARPDAARLLADAVLALVPRHEVQP